MKKIILAAISVSFLSGCAVDQTTASNEPVQDKEYQTGSNIPRKKTGAAVISREEWERNRDANITNTYPGPGGGKGP